MRVLVIGASGFIGSHIVKKLLNEGHTVGAFVHNSKRIWRIKKEVQKGYVKLHVGDITRKGDVKSAIKKGDYEVLINTVAILSHPDESLLKQVNALGLKNILEVALEYNVEGIIHTSVACLQGRKAIKSEYFKTKLIGENYAREFHYKGLNTAIIRLTPVYGPLDNKGLTLIILAAANSMLPMFPGSPKAKLKLIYVEDVASYYSKLVNSKIKGLKYYTLCGEETLTLGELFKIIEKESGGQAPIFLPHRYLQNLLAVSSSIFSKVLRIKNFAIDQEILELFWLGNYRIKCSYMRKWKPKYSFIEGIKETIKWARKNGLSSRIRLLSLMIKG